MLLFWPVFWSQSNCNCTGIRSNRWTRLFILIGSENLYPVMHDPVVVLVAVPNISTKVICKDNLEELNRYAEKNHPVHGQPA
jgi:hypothetical protein